MTLSIEKKALDKIEQERNDRLRKPGFLLSEAKEEFKKIKEKSFSDLVNCSVPGPNVKTLFEIVLILLKRKVIMEEYVKGKKVQNYWKSIQEMLKHTKRFRSDLLHFEKKNLPIAKETLEQVHEKLSNFKVEKGTIQSSLGVFAPLYLWVLAITDYDKICKDTEHLKNSIAEQAAKVKEIADDYQKTLEESNIEEKKLEEMKAREQQLSTDKEALQAKIAATITKLACAQELTKWLKADAKAWTISLKSLEQQQKNLTGDILLTAGHLVYLGAFPGTWRRYIVRSLWVPVLEKVKAGFSEEYELAKALGCCAEVMLWRTKGLVSDGAFEENAIAMSEVDKCPLLIDPQGQGRKFLLKKHEGKVVTLRQRGDYLRKLRTVSPRSP